MARRRTLVGLLAVITLMATAGGCRLKDQSQPSLTGPSELALSLAMTAQPDVVVRDGGSQSEILIQARNATAQPVANLTVHLAILCLDANQTRQVVDFGSLSASSVVTGSDGTASVMYTAPSANSPLNSYCSTSTVWISGIPVGTNYANALPRQVEIGLVAAGSTLPPFTLVPDFTVTPDAPMQRQTVSFDASASTPASGIASYKWTFGDGGTASGKVVSHIYSGANSFLATLTIKDAFGRATSLTKTVTVSAAPAPTAAFTFSPDSPAPNQTVYFNGSTSAAIEGHSIVGYNWDFGDGTGAVGAQPAHAYNAAGTYVVTLTVTDDLGNTASTSVSVTIS